MFTVELYAAIRRAVMADALSRREAAKRFGVHRNTITKMLQYSIPPGYRRRERPASKKLGPYMAWIDNILEGDRSVHKKQRHTAQRIFERLRDEEGFSGGYTMALSRCRTKDANDLVDDLVYAAAVAERHVSMAEPRKARCVLAEMRWR